ncbi:methyltransferase [bacterium SCSIO 12696]|nr:methyltransferase [bacterium SCSIO 12696]
MDTFDSPYGPIGLTRYPAHPKDTLRAWDAADEYLVNYLAEQPGINPNSQVLILNDSFGALAVTLCTGFPGLQPISIGDSWLSHRGTDHNLTANQLSPEAVKLHSSLEWPKLEQTFNLVVIKIPKSLSLLEDQLHRLQQFISVDTVVVAASMVKYLHNSHLTLFERLLGATTTSLAKKKARLVFCKPGKHEPVENPYPKTCPIPELKLEVSNHANVFSRDKLDIGTRFFLEHLPANDRYQQIIDLGCGNGLLGIVAAQRNPQADMTFVDESFMAVASAKTNFSANFADRNATFKVTDCLQGIAKNSADLIVNNPPFHQQNAVSTQVAEQMFRESKQVLKTGGELWVIGNRHLGYHVKLKRLFGNCQTVVSNQKFVILKSTKK